MIIAEATTGFLAGYFATCRRSSKTMAAYKIDLAQMEKYVGGNTALNIEPEILESWADDMRSHGYAPISIRRKFATARVFFAYWVRKKIIEKSPLWQIRLDLGRERLLPRSLTKTDTKRLIEQVWQNVETAGGLISKPADAYFLGVRNIAALEILFATGIRVGELVSLRLRDWCDDDASFVISGKGSRQRLAFLPDDRSRRAVRCYLKYRRALNIDHDALLLNASGLKISTQGIARMLAFTAKDAAIVSKVTPHMIRHTVATLLLRYGADIRIVQEVLGHASIATTQRYTHVSKEQLVSTLQSRHPNFHIDIRTNDAIGRSSD